ncbi:TonB-dependent receptor [Sediminibacterium sp.]|uniref:TonB-dependent receptor n=1 Tax=Sediminibacterium sp. TaxID=1917865 RepID=UPI002728FA16|nr:TonB-dependent receptor [Sediminibacterium sp.]MDO8996182.1 TonB-dependent receptor [Sediminibacterium sp.]MDP1972798.1 TonB-dependent receptor [Sediminibacterium sp.]MDP2420899.1 TonB-dependent receptor [Sediminibacterium sp.]
MRKWYLLIFILHWTLVGVTQEKLTLNGYIKDGLSGETLIGANILVKGTGKTVTSNNFGFFSITLNKGKYQLSCSYIGYQTKEFDLDLNINTEQLIQLLPNAATILQDVTVSARRRDNNVKTAQMGKIELSVNTAKALPAFLGEVDILKTLQLMPGVRNAGEGNAGFYVRGGGPDQNLILLDDAVVYNTGHLFGFFSVFNSDAIKNVSLIKGGMPAQYGGRLSSVVDIAMKEGNNNKTQIDAGIGLIASRFSIQGPIKSKKSSFIVSARRTYIDAITKPLISKSSDFYGSGYYFYDLNAKMNFQISEKDHLYISGYFGRDKFNFNNAARSFKTLIDWGNATSTVRWNHVFNKKLFSNTTLVYNDYHFNLNGAQNDFNINLSSGIRDLTAKTDFDYYASPEHKLKFGVQFTHHTFLPNIVSGNQDSVVFTPNNASKKFAREWAVYLQDDWEINTKLKLNLGLRYSLFQQTGKYTNYSRDNNGNKLDSTVYGAGQVVQQYGGLEPRATLRYTLNETSSVKAGITRNLQYIHLVTNAGSSLPTDLWVPSTLRVKPQLSWQYAAGYFKNFNNGMFETSVEVYYKTMENQIEYREGYTPSLKDPEEEFVFGRGWSYGAEFFINKVKGRLTGWIGYTLGWTWRKFPDLNQGQQYPSRYDRRHDLSVVANYTINDKWKIAGVFVYGTGNAISVPERFYFIGGVLSQQYSGINAYRMRAYHRMDIAATYTPKPKKERKYTTNWVFSLYNAYSRANPYFLYFDQEGSASNGTLNVSAKQVSLFPVLPSVTWNVKL